MPYSVSSDLIIPEIGYNHLGSLFNLRAMMDLLSSRFNCFTVQLREDFFPEKEYLHIDNDKVIEEIKIIRRKFPEVKVGLATESANYIQRYFTFFDFFKIISDGINNTSIPRILSAENKFHTYSVGSISPKNIVEKLSSYYPKGIINCLNYTSFDLTGSDMSLKEIIEYSKHASGLTLGVHQASNNMILASFASLEFQNVFVYLQLLQKPFTSPDDEHSRTFEELIKLEKDLNNIIEFKNRPFRDKFINFDHEIASPDSGIF